MKLPLGYRYSAVYAGIRKVKPALPFVLGSKEQEGNQAFVRPGRLYARARLSPRLGEPSRRSGLWVQPLRWFLRLQRRQARLLMRLELLRRRSALSRPHRARTEPRRMKRPAHLLRPKPSLVGRPIRSLSPKPRQRTASPRHDNPTF